MTSRIQRPRVSGWKPPTGAVFVGKPSKFGNPYTPKIIPGWATMTREYAVEDYRRWLLHPHGTRRMGGTGELLCWCLELGNRDDVLASLHKLGGKDLACYCPESQPCHADVLLELANKAEAA